MFNNEILLAKYKIPSIFISKFKIGETNNNAFHFCCFSYDDIDSHDYVFITVPELKDNKSPIYGLIVNNDNNIKISINNLQESCKEMIIKVIKKRILLENYIDLFQRNVKKKYQKV